MLMRCQADRPSCKGYLIPGSHQPSNKAVWTNKTKTISVIKEGGGGWGRWREGLQNLPGRSLSPFQPLCTLCIHSEPNRIPPLSWAQPSPSCLAHRESSDPQTSILNSPRSPVASGHTGGREPSHPSLSSCFSPGRI